MLVVRHRRARSARGSHPVVTVVAKAKSDNCAAHPLSRRERGDKRGWDRREGYFLAGRGWWIGAGCADSLGLPSANGLP